MATGQQPTYQAFTVIKRDGQDDFWLNIGAAFMHQDGDGYNVVLQALPINGKIVLRLPKSPDDKQQPNRDQPTGEPTRNNGNNKRRTDTRRDRQ